MFGGLGFDANGNPGVLNDLWEYLRSSGEWLWLGGSSTIPACSSAASFCGVQGVYGTLGMPDAGNVPGGRVHAVSWTDSNGNFWLFGGAGYDGNGSDGILNDLWEFNPTVKEWTWKSGSSAVPNCGSSSICGPPGVYGTLGVPAAENIPGGRWGATGWISGGDLWLFGGVGSDSNSASEIGDLWRYDPASDEWTWMSGSVPTQDFYGYGIQTGVYGTLGEPAPGNVPGSRYGGVSWTDNNGNLWLFGGWGYQNYGQDIYSNYLNDLWEFTPSTSEWTWMSGSSTWNQYIEPHPGVAGTEGTPAAGNTPGSRWYSNGWLDQNGDLWLFGGFGADSAGDMGYLNDLWEFNAVLEEWAWVGGESAFACTASGCEPPLGNYGTLGTSAASNVPGGRDPGAVWTDPAGDFWLFGGQGNEPAGSGGTLSEGYLNDLWMYSPYVPKPPNFTFGASPGSLTVNSGGEGAVTLTVTPQNGFNSTVSFASSGLPSGTSCSFSPSTVTPSGSAATTQLTISASAQAANQRRSSWPFLPTSALAVAMCLIGWKRRRHGLHLLLLVAAFTALGLISACGGAGGTGGGGGGGGGTQPVNATVTVTATSGSIQQATSILLTVN